jgi:hypothetical protein
MVDLWLAAYCQVLLDDYDSAALGCMDWLMEIVF